MTSGHNIETILAELSSREPIFHRSEFGVSRADFEALMDGQFREVGASGRQYSREYVLEILEERHSNPHPDTWQTSEFDCLCLADGVYLLTYTLLQDGTRLTRRSTIWRRVSDSWKIVFHQGTIVQGSQK